MGGRMRDQIGQFIWRLLSGRSAASFTSEGVRSFSRTPTAVRGALTMVAVTVMCGGYFCVVSAVPSARGDVGREAHASKAVGFDSCIIPSVGNDVWLYKHKDKFGADFAYIGFYVGGVTAAAVGCNRPTKGAVNQLYATGFDFLLIMNGRQPPCSKESKIFFSANPANNYGRAREAGEVEANIAVKRMKEHGFTGPEGGSIVYYDIESFYWEEYPGCLDATKQFIASWDRTLKNRWGVSAGLYGPTSGSNLRAFWTSKDKPDDIWFSETYVGEKEVPEKHERREINEEYKSVWSPSMLHPKSPALPDEDWENRRLHQWERDYPYKENLFPHTQFHFDLNCAMGLVAGLGVEREEPKNAGLCQAK
jgi:hypothetical protein